MDWNRSIKEPLFPADLYTLEQRQNGAIKYHIAGVIYLFFALAVVCNEYFIPSLDIISRKLKVSKGFFVSSFLAAGFSLPELFISLSGAFISFNDVGIGMIVGSAMFNTLFGIGMCSLFARKTLTLSLKQLLRDCGFFIVSLLTITHFLRDGRIWWWEALLIIIIYIFYLISVKLTEDRSNGSLATDENVEIASEPSNDFKMPTLAQPDEVVLETETNETGPFNAWPLNTTNWIVKLLFAPFFWLTLPNTRTERGKKFYLITFFGSIVWISVLTYLMVWLANAIGETEEIPPEVMGLAILTPGVLIPFLITSVVLTRRGQGEIAVSLTLSKNIFYVALGLPLPWFLYSIIYSEPIVVSSEGLVCSTAALFIVSFLVFCSIAALGWKIKKVFGVFLGLLYFVLLILSLAFEYGWIVCPI